MRGNPTETDIQAVAVGPIKTKQRGFVFFLFRDQSGTRDRTSAGSASKSAIPFIAVRASENRERYRPDHFIIGPSMWPRLTRWADCNG